MAPGCTLSQGAPPRARIVKVFASRFLGREMTHHPKRIKKVCCFLKRLEKKICQIKSLCFFSEITHHRNDTRSRAENSPAQGNLQEAHHFFDENWAVIARLEPHSKQSHEKWQVHPAPRAPRLRAAAAVTFRQSLCVPRTQGA